MQTAIIDVGSNSIHLKIYEIKGKKHHTLLHQKVSGGLIAYVENNMMNRNGIKRLLSILSDYQSICDLIGLTDIHCFATASLRNIVNQQEIVEVVQQKLGFTIDIISGYVESNLGFIGLKDSFHCENGLTMDMGGGSTEILKFKDGEIEQVTSLPFGCLSLYQQNVSIVLPSDRERKVIRRYVKEQLKPILWLQSDVIYLTGGTAKSFARVHRALGGDDLKDIHGYTLSFAEFQELYRYLLRHPRETAHLLTKLVPERVHTLFPGLTAYKVLFQTAGCKQIIVSESGVREGYLCKRILSI